MIAEIPVISPVFQTLLNSVGWVLARVYDVVPNYGFAIIAVTVLLRVLVLPLGIKQVKSMMAMQALQPRIADIRKRYKGNQAKIQEETMRLYKEAGVNPFGSCLPVLLQFPFLIAMYSVIRPPAMEPIKVKGVESAYEVVNNHLPTDSQLFRNTIRREGLDFLYVLKLDCSMKDAGTQTPIKDNGNRAEGIEASQVEVGGVVYSFGKPVPGDDGQVLTLTKDTEDCGNGIPAKIPYVILLGLMVATTFYQQRQMQKVSPPGASSSQQQAIMKYFPLFFAFLGFSFPSGLVLYWTVANVFMVTQQAVLIRAGHVGPAALDKQREKQTQRAESGEPVKKGWLANLVEQANAQQANQKSQQDRPAKDKGSTGGGKSGKNGSGSSKGGSGRSGGSGRPGTSGGGNRSKQGGSGGPRPKKKPGNGKPEVGGEG